MIQQLKNHPEVARKTWSFPFPSDPKMLRTLL